ncbi:hypothetical protein LINPERPRIM_LOCUS40030, partial [Linum perenne]
VSTLHSTAAPTHQHYLLLLEYQELLSRPWQVKISHVFREANQVWIIWPTLVILLILVFFSLIFLTLRYVIGSDTIRLGWRCHVSLVLIVKG